MSTSDGGKPAQTGLVDMGVIQFYNLPQTNPANQPTFTVSDLTNYPGSFSEMVLNVTWNQLQPSPNGPIDFSPIDSALSAVAGYNAQHPGANLGVKLRVWGGFTAPDWAKNIDGPAFTITGESVVDPNVVAPQTIGRWWTADYVDAWNSLQNALGSRYDSNPLVRGMSQTAGMSASDEPFVPLKTAAPVSSNPNQPTVNQVNTTQRAGFTDAAEMLTLRAAISDYAQWATTPLDFTFNPFSVLDNFVSTGTNSPALNDNFTLAVLQQARNSTRMVQAGNHTIGAGFAAVSFILQQMAADAELDPAAIPASYQTASPLKLGDTLVQSNYPGWQNAVQIGVDANAGNIELWDYSQNNGFLGLSAAQVSGLATQLASGIAPTTAAPDDGSALAFLAPANVTGSPTGSPGTVAFSGTDAVLLESATQQGTYRVTLTSLKGGALAVTNLGGIVSGPASGSTLSFAGSLAQVNTVLASLRDTLASGTDVVQITATDGSGHTAMRNVGVQISTAASGPSSGGPDPGAAAAAFQGNGMLVVGGVQASQNVAGNLQIGPGSNSTLLAALAPSAYSTASLTVGGTFEVLAGGTARFTGTLGAPTIQIDGSSGGLNAGTLSGDGTLSALGGGSIANNGTIEAVADLTLGLQRLTVTNNLAGTGTLAIDAGATMVLGGKVASTQTVQFASNTAQQFANGPYSPSTLEISAPPYMFAPITGFTFADRLVLDGVTAKLGPGSTTNYDNTTHTLIIQQQAGPTLTYSLTGDPSSTDLGSLNLNVVSQNGQTVVSFVSPTTTPVRPSITAPSDVQGSVGVPVLIPNIVLNTPMPSPTAPAVSTLVTVALSVASGTLSAGTANGNTSVNGNGTGSIALSGTLDAVESSLQTLTYTAAAAGTASISLWVSDWAGISTTSTISVHNNAAPLQFAWNNFNGGSFVDSGNWTAVPHNAPPGGGNVATFAGGPYTVSGDGAVAEVVVFGTTTLTGQVSAQGRGGVALSVDLNGALTLAGGAAFTAQQEAVVGDAGHGALVVMGGALDLTGPAGANALSVGRQKGGIGAVVNLEQITANGVVVVGSAGTGTLALAGVASSMSDGGADIGQLAGGQGSVSVNGGEWMNNGLLTVGDAGLGSLLINGAAGGVTGQVTAYNATIGNQAGSQGSVVLDAGELLVANTAAATNTLAVGGAGTGELAVEDGSEVAVGVAQGTVANNNGQLVVGGTAGGQGRVRIGGDSKLLVYGNAAVGAAGASGGALAAYGNSAAASGAATGTITVGASADDIALFSLLGTLSVGRSGQVALGGSHATVRASAIDIAQGGAIAGAGTLSGLGGGNRTVTLASIDNEGSILASGGNLLVYGDIHGTGTLLIDANSQMTLQAAVGSGQMLAFGHNSTAVLNDARAFAGTITGFGSDDLIELANTQATGASWANGVLTISTAFGPLLLNLAGNYTSNFFTVRSDGLGGTFVAGGNGDVHMLTFKGLAYDFQAVGDFVAVQASNGADPWQLQIRTESFPSATSITTELAAMVGDTRVSFAFGRDALLHVDGAADDGLQVGGVQSFAGGSLAQLAANVYQLRWDTGRSVTVTDQGGYLDWTVGLGAQDGPGSVKGLLGSNSGQDSDFALSDGTVLHQPGEAEILGVFAESWRVTPGGSLLDAANPAPLAQAMAANLVATGASYDTSALHQDVTSQAATTLLTPSSLHG
jgi:hypothetical protein